MEIQVPSSPETSQPYSSNRVGISQSLVVGFVAMLDALVIVASSISIYFLYVHAVEPDLISYYLTASAAMTFVSVQVLWTAGLYRFSAVVDPLPGLVRLDSIICGVFLLLISATFALKVSDAFSRVWAFGWLGSMLFLLPVSRVAASRLLAGLAARDVVGRNIAIYGAGSQGAAIIRHIKAANHPWDKIVAVFDDRRTRTETDSLGYPVTGNLSDLLSLARQDRIDDILIALPWNADQRLMQITELLSVLPADVRLSPEFMATDLLHRRIGYAFGVPMLNLLTKPVSGWSALLKQSMDFFFGVLFLLLAAPLMLLIALWIKLDSPGPILFRQPRYGFNNQLFDVYKFRTMYHDQCDTAASKLTTRDDPRVTFAGAILRRTSLDELPQLFNVIRGEMSVVGPRPHAQEAKAGTRRYEEVVEKYALRHKVKPGITGWAQVNGWRGNTETEEDLIGRLEHDLYYIDNWSVLLDLLIIFRTAFVMARGENSY